MSWLPIELWKKIIIQHVNFRECRQKDFALVCKLWMEIVNGAQYSYIIPQHLTPELIWKYRRGINWTNAIATCKLTNEFIYKYELFKYIPNLTLIISSELNVKYFDKFSTDTKRILIRSGYILENFINNYVSKDLLCDIIE